MKMFDLEQKSCLHNCYVNSSSELYVSSEAAIGGVLWKNVFLKISQNWQETNCARVSFFSASASSFFK